MVNKMDVHRNAHKRRENKEFKVFFEASNSSF